MRDECVALHGPDSKECAELIEAHKRCLRAEGFNVGAAPGPAGAARPGRLCLELASAWRNRLALLPLLLCCSAQSRGVSGQQTSLLTRRSEPSQRPPRRPAAAPALQQQQPAAATGPTGLRPRAAAAALCPAR